MAAPKVVVSIKPIHSLIAGVMKNVGEPVLLIDGNTSPHTASLKPSQARALQEADLVFWIGPELEVSLTRSLKTLARKTTSIELQKLDGLRFPTLKNSKSNDPHIWLDPQNALVIISSVTKILVEHDEKNASHYLANAAQISEMIFKLEREIHASLKQVHAIPFLSFHDAYGHYEGRFGLKNGIAVTGNPEAKTGAAHIASLQQTIKQQNIRCIFSEPQFDSKILNTLSTESGTRIYTLDPLGGGIEKGPAQYFTMMRKLTDAFIECLGSK
ncbi:MAG: zinc ABC transporter substrate-binding protein [Rhizobiaceae bacterium]